MRLTVNLIAPNFGPRGHFKNWLRSTTSSVPLIRFRFVFAVIWLIYDLMDLISQGTQGSFWFYRDRTVPHQIVIFQVFLILCELSVVLGFKPRTSLLLACIFRALEAYLFPLNDFLYFCVTALLLAHFDDSFSEKKGKGQAWVRDVIVLETAWIYLSTVFLKLNPFWLSGGDLYARQMFHIASHNWLYPEFYKKWVTHILFNESLACAAVLFEFVLAVTLIYWCFGKQKKYASKLAAILVVLIHGFAALALNVWFFSASMIAQVIFLTSDKNEAK
jgi:hypothetical protein